MYQARAIPNIRAYIIFRPVKNDNSIINIFLDYFLIVVFVTADYMELNIEMFLFYLFCHPQQFVCAFGLHETPDV